MPTHQPISKLTTKLKQLDHMLNPILTVPWKNVFYVNSCIVTRSLLRSVTVQFIWFTLSGHFSSGLLASSADVLTPQRTSLTNNHTYRSLYSSGNSECHNVCIQNLLRTENCPSTALVKWTKLLQGVRLLSLNQDINKTTKLWKIQPDTLCH